jgi:hypothetical protein
MSIDKTKQQQLREAQARAKTSGTKEQGRKATERLQGAERNAKWDAEVAALAKQRNISRQAANLEVARRHAKGARTKYENRQAMKIKGSTSGGTRVIGPTISPPSQDRYGPGGMFSTIDQPHERQHIWRR